MPSRLPVLGVYRRISLDNVAGNVRKRSEAMALLGSKQNQGRRPTPVVVETMDSSSPTPSSGHSSPPSGPGAIDSPRLLAANEGLPWLDYEHGIYEVPRVAPGDGLSIVTAGLGVNNASNVLAADDPPWASPTRHLPSPSNRRRPKLRSFPLPISLGQDK